MLGSKRSVDQPCSRVDDDDDDDDELILHCDTATEGCVSNDFFRHSLDDSPASYLR